MKRTAKRGRKAPATKDQDGGGDEKKDETTKGKDKEDYEKWTVAKLKEALGKKGLATEGKKAELVARMKGDVQDAKDKDGEKSDEPTGEDKEEGKQQEGGKKRVAKRRSTGGKEKEQEEGKGKGTESEGKDQDANNKSVDKGKGKGTGKGKGKGKEVDEEELEGWTVAKLKEKLRKRGKKADGNKALLIARLKRSLEKGSDNDDDSDEGKEDEEEDKENKKGKGNSSSGKATTGRKTKRRSSSGSTTSTPRRKTDASKKRKRGKEEGKEGKLEGMYFVVSGKFDMSKKKIQKIIIANDGHINVTVSARTTHFIWDGDEEAEGYTKASEQSKKIISLQDLLRMVGEDDEEKDSSESSDDSILAEMPRLKKKPRSRKIAMDVFDYDERDEKALASYIASPRKSPRKRKPTPRAAASSRSPSKYRPGESYSRSRR